MSSQAERIRARRERIEERSNARLRSGCSATNDPREGCASRRSEAVEAAIERISEKESRTSELVSDVRVDADFNEQERRKEVGSRQTPVERPVSVEPWEELLKVNMPMKLHSQIEKQKANCDELLAAKDAVIGSIRRELKIKDDEYVKALKQQGDDIEQLLSRMAVQYKELRQVYDDELQRIEEAFVRERKEVLDINRSEIDSLFEKRRAMEMKYMEERQERQARYQKELDELRRKDAEDYNQLKIKLETDIQELEQQLEQMQATYQLNSEKLDFNHRILAERDTENAQTLAQQKRKLARLKDNLTALVGKYNNMDAKYKQENMALTEEYRRITEQYKDLQAKFRHFEIADNKKFREVWEMHKEEILEETHILMNADKLITEEMLGRPWQAPDSLVFAEEHERNLINQREHATIAKKEKEENILDEKDSVFKEKLDFIVGLIKKEAGFLCKKNESVLKALNIGDKQEIKELMDVFLEPGDEHDGTKFCLRIKPSQVVKAVKEFIDRRNKITKTQKESAERERIDEEKEEKEIDIQSGFDMEYWSRLSVVVSNDRLQIWKHLETAMERYLHVVKGRAHAIDEIHSLKAENENLRRQIDEKRSSEDVESLIIKPMDTF